MDYIIPIGDNSISNAVQHSIDVAEQLSVYDTLIAHGIVLVLIGIFVVFIIQKLISHFLYPHLKNTRLIGVAFSTIYVLIFVVVVLLSLSKLGFDISRISIITVLLVLGGAILACFLTPFFPRLPFKQGHMIEVDDVTGIVDAISPFHTTVRTFDGTMAFIPNKLIFTSIIMNYSEVSERREEFEIIISHGSSINEAKKLLLDIMFNNSKVVNHPEKPYVLVNDADVNGINLTAYCWVRNDDWLRLHDILWADILYQFNTNEKIVMARPQHDIYINR